MGLGEPDALQSHGLSVRVVPGAELPEFAQEIYAFTGDARRPKLKAKTILLQNLMKLLSSKWPCASFSSASRS